MFRKIWAVILASFKPQPLGFVFPAKIVNVVDADSLQIQVKWHRYNIRLVGVDGPEYQQAFGADSFQHLVRLAYSSNRVTVERFGFDKFGRMLARVVVGDTDLALGLLQAGFAWHTPAYSQKSIPEHAADYAQASHQARQAGRGLWSQADPMHPAQFRAGLRTPTRSRPAKARQFDLFS
jgi:endonuclease YncB( thermonuclease family)